MYEHQATDMFIVPAKRSRIKIRVMRTERRRCRSVEGIRKMDKLVVVEEIFLGWDPNVREERTEVESAMVDSVKLCLHRSLEL